LPISKFCFGAVAESSRPKKKNKQHKLSHMRGSTVIDIELQEFQELLNVIHKSSLEIPELTGGGSLNGTNQFIAY
jgi:hypothetical protein